MAEQASNYEDTFRLINPGAPGMYQFAAAFIPDAEGMVCLLIETDTSSEKHFWPLGLAEEAWESLGLQIQALKEDASKLTIARDIPTDLNHFRPNGSGG